MDSADGPVEYSSRLGPISVEQFQTALDHFELGQFISAAPITDGLFGQNVFVNSTSGQYVLRGCPHSREQFPREQFHARMLHERTSAPVPWPYLLDEDDEVFGWSYVMMPRMAGISTRDRAFRRTVSNEDAIGIAKTLATTLADMQELTWHVLGLYDPNSCEVEPFDKPYVDWILSDMHASIETARAANDKTTDADLKWISDIVESSRNALRVPYSPCYVFHDFREGNMVLQKEDDGWHVSGLFDLMEGFFADGEIDLSRTSAIFGGDGKPVVRAFLETYLNLKPPREGFAERFRIYMLEDCLTIWSYFQSHDAPWMRKYPSFRSSAEKSVMLLSTLGLD